MVLPKLFAEAQMGYVFCGFIFLNLLYVAMKDIAIRTEAKYYSIIGYAVIFIVVALVSTLFDVRSLFSYANDVPIYMIITFLALMIVCGACVLFASVYIACEFHIINCYSNFKQMIAFIFAICCVFQIVFLSIQFKPEQFGLQQTQLLQEFIFAIIPAMTGISIIFAHIVRKVTDN